MKQTCLPGFYVCNAGFAGSQNFNNPDVLALLNQAPPDTLDQLVRGGYLPHNSSSSSLQGLAPSAAHRSLDSQQGTSRERFCCCPYLGSILVASVARLDAHGLVHLDP